MIKKLILILIIALLIGCKAQKKIQTNFHTIQLNKITCNNLSEDITNQDELYIAIIPIYKNEITLDSNKWIFTKNYINCKRDKSIQFDTIIAQTTFELDSLSSLYLLLIENDSKRPSEFLRSKIKDHVKTEIDLINDSLKVTLAKAIKDDDLLGIKKLYYKNEKIDSNYPVLKRYIRGVILFDKYEYCIEIVYK